MSGEMKELMRNTLDNLTMADFKRFKHYLRDQGQIAWGKLEMADRDDAVDLMCQTYATAGVVMVAILQKMNHNQLATELGIKLEKVGSQQSNPWQGGGGGGGVNVSVMAHSGGMVNAPAMSGCTFSGPVNFGFGAPMAQHGGAPNYGQGPSGNRTGGQDFFKRHKGTLETRLGVLAPLLIELERCCVISSIEREEVQSKPTSHEKNFELIRMLERKGVRAQEKFFEALQAHDPLLLEDLQRS